MANFNINVQEAGYSPAPPPAEKIYDNTAQQSLLGMLQDLVGAGARGLVNDQKKEDSLDPAFKEYRVAAAEGLKLEGMTPNEREMTTDITAQREIDRRMQEMEIQYESGQMSPEQLQTALADVQNEIKIGKAKASQSRNFNFNQHMAQTYYNIAEKYGDTVAITVFEKMQGSNASPIRFVSEKLVEAEQKAREKATEAQVQTLEKYAEKKYGRVRRPGESSVEFAQWVANQDTMYARQNSIMGQIQYLRTNAGGGEYEDPKVVEDRIKGLEGQLVGELNVSQDTTFLDVAAKLNPMGATAEQRLVYSQQLQQAYNTELARITNSIQSNESARSTAISGLDKKFAYYRDLIEGKTAKDTQEYSTQISALSKIAELQREVPMFRNMQALNTISQLLTVDAKFATQFSGMISTTGGNQILRYMLGDQAAIPDGNAVTSADWSTFMKNMTGLMSTKPEFAKIAATWPVKVFQDSFNPYSGKVSNWAGFVGFTDFLGSEEFLRYGYPMAEAQFTQPGMQRIYSTALTDMGRGLTAQLQNAPSVQSIFEEAEGIDGKKQLVVRVTNSGDIGLSYIDKATGREMNLLNQDTSQDVRRVRNGIRSIVRAMAHIQGSRDYAGQVDDLLAQINITNPSIKFLTEKEFSAFKASTEQKK